MNKLPIGILLTAMLRLARLTSWPLAARLPFNAMAAVQVQSGGAREKKPGQGPSENYKLVMGSRKRTNHRYIYIHIYEYLYICKHMYVYILYVYMYVYITC